MNVERGSDEKSYLTEFKTLTAGCPACGAAAAELDWAGGCRVATHLVTIISPAAHISTAQPSPAQPSSPPHTAHQTLLCSAARLCCSTFLTLLHNTGTVI